MQHSLTRGVSEQKCCSVMTHDWFGEKKKSANTTSGNKKKTWRWILHWPSKSSGLNIIKNLPSFQTYCLYKEKKKYFWKEFPGALFPLLNPSTNCSPLVVWEVQRKMGTQRALRVLLPHFHHWRVVHEREVRGLGDFPRPAAASPPLGCSLTQP